MFRYLILVYLFSYLHNTHSVMSNGLFNDREMVMAFVVNRHGERSPDSDEISLSNEKEKILNLTYIEGPEGLTNAGKRRGYQIGKFIRQRYGSEGYKLLSNIYFQDEISVRSTDKERTKMTAQVAMAAVYPPEVEQQWDEGLGKIWQPVPYTAVPLSEDYLRYYSNCKRFTELMQEVKRNSIHEEFEPFSDLFPTVLAETGRDFKENPLLFQALFDLFKSQVALGLDIPEWAKPNLARLGEASRLAYRLYFKTDEMKRIGGGVILNDFISAANDIVAGKVIKKRFRMFSAHDFNIGSLMEVTQITGSDHIVPEYGSLFALELYRTKSNGEFSVLPVYLPKAGESIAQQLHFKGCESNSFCSYSKFVNLTKKFLLPEKEFYRICGIKTEL
ncbi:venom acid phosphatase Acph-1-like [Battus philenor]|uniref:venom acid phosphatase Acph-1-like n=1 Tax=Battus philenor TaxID=42288 RepID=UPI0035CF7969